MPERKADFVCISHEAADHNYPQAASGAAQVIRGCASRQLGPYRVSGELAQTSSGQPLTLWNIECPGGLRVVHLGALSSQLDGDQVAALKGCHLLLAPVGSGAQPALSWIEQLQPARVIPMRFRTPFTRREHFPDLQSEAPFLQALKLAKENLNSGCFELTTDGAPRCLIVPHLYQ
jgi:hypothetical protein